MKRLQISTDELLRLLDCADYRAFILAIMEIRSRSQRFGFSHIARSAGFSARSFPRDVANGTKKLTPLSLDKFVKGLGLRGDLAHYFQLIVKRDEPGCRLPHTRPEIEKLIAASRSRLRQKNKASFHAEEKAYSLPVIPLVYAALGSPTRGATVREMISRTQLTAENVQAALKHLKLLGLVEEFEGNRFKASANHLDFTGLAKSKVFEEHFRHVLTQALDSSKKDFSSDDHLYLSSAFSIRKSRLPGLKAELRDLLLRYVDEAEENSGDRVVQLACSLF